MSDDWSTWNAVAKWKTRRATVYLDRADPHEPECFPSEPHVWLSAPDFAALTYDESDESLVRMDGLAIVETKGCLRCGTKRTDTYHSGPKYNGISLVQVCDCPERDIPGHLGARQYVPAGWVHKMDNVRSQYISNLDARTCEEMQEKLAYGRASEDTHSYTLTELKEIMDAISDETLGYWRRLGVPLDVEYSLASEGRVADMLLEHHDPGVYLDYDFH